MRAAGSGARATRESLWPAGTFVGEPSSLHPWRKPEERERHDALRRDCIVAGMLHRVGQSTHRRSGTACYSSFLVQAKRCRGSDSSFYSVLVSPYTT